MEGLLQIHSCFFSPSSALRGGIPKKILLLA